jgi:hypothetical protein
VNENILVCDDIMDDESIYSIIETEKIEYDEEKESSKEEIDLIDELVGLKIEMMDQIDFKYKWDHKKGDSNIRCVFRIYYQNPGERVACSLCLRQACISCLKQQNDKKNQLQVNTIYEEDNMKPK